MNETRAYVNIQINYIFAISILQMNLMRMYILETLAAQKVRLPRTIYWHCAETYDVYQFGCMLRRLGQKALIRVLQHYILTIHSMAVSRKVSENSQDIYPILFATNTMIVRHQMSGLWRFVRHANHVFRNLIARPYMPVGILHGHKPGRGVAICVNRVENH